MAAPNLPAAVAPGTVVREEFAARELMQQAERAAVQVAAQAKAEVEARYLMALRRPRDWDEVRVALLQNCKHPTFAKAARYKVPNRGEGFTIRFAEALAQHMGNIYAPTFVIYEDDERRIVRVTPTDLERNITWSKDVTINKTVERQNADGRELIRVRRKADGGTVSIVRATEEEMIAKENALVSKAARTGVLRMVPPDLLEECLQAVRQTISNKDAEDPEAQRKEIADAFARQGVTPVKLKEFLGCELSEVAPSELQGLREIYQALREGNVTWREIMSEKRRGPEDDATTEPKPSEFKERLRTKQRVPRQEDKDAEDGDLKAIQRAKWDALPDLSVFPDAMEYAVGAVIKVSGELYHSNLDRTAWQKFTP